ncbi:MAG: Re/Si-specific NAD(P)(+) transhydrogenase subunit alpha [Myxococcales bacterium]|nr:Re/Si-specific NAD(P)(+) transhydrogenase subunit alpha [Myxococcales bacterium]
MLVAIPKEKSPRERRVALVPDGVKALSQLGCEVVVEAGAGVEAGFPDSEYKAAGARIEPDAAAVLAAGEIVVKVSPPTQVDGAYEIDRLRKDAIYVGFLRPLDETETAAHLARHGVTSFSMELIPRITRAQAMDALSSQATIMGYQAVLDAASNLGKFFPMLVTAAGTISPARVLVVGAGVAGLQAIATAKRLGAVVEAYDTRAVVKEQVESVGGRFVELDLDTGDSEDAGGYAKAQSEEFYAKQRQLLGEVAKKCDVVITTALVPGIRAPRLIEEDAVAGMRPGSVIVDLAAANGGNVALSRPDEVVKAHGVTIYGPTNLASSIPFNASQMYSKNVTNFLAHLIDEGKVELDLEDELTSGALLTHQGKIANERVRGLVEGGN